MINLNRRSALSSFLKYDMLIRLILINLSVFLIIKLLALPFWLMASSFSPEQITSKWLSMPSYPESLLIKPWTIITYMFLHHELGHVFWNMLIFYFVGGLFIRFFGERKLLTTYLAGGIAGAVLYFIFYNIFPIFQEINPYARLLGASASVMAIFIATAAHAPNYIVRLFGLFEVKLKYLGIAYFVIDLIGISNSNSGGHIAHVGGAVFGFLFASQMKKNKDITSWVNTSINFISALFKPSKKRSKMKVKYKSENTKNYDYNARKKEEQREVDEILDKISKSGYDSLSKREKEILFKASNQ